ncbi:MAG: chemotaxis protein CheA [Firmicutes bacterium]|nr:chemotaxis protein CheA [Bacillota bacterium]
MAEDFMDESMLEIFLFETEQNIEQLENIVLISEKANTYSEESIREIFRIMHTIKGSAAMMMLNNLSTLAHRMEDLFYFLREAKPHNVDYSALSDLILDGIDFIKSELEKLQTGGKADGDAAALNDKIQNFLAQLKEENAAAVESAASKEVSPVAEKKIIQSRQKDDGLSGFEAIIHFEDGCEMENIRAFSVIHNLQEKKLAQEIYYEPEDLLDSDASIETIRKNGFKVIVYTDKSFEEMQQFFLDTLFLQELEFRRLETAENTESSEEKAKAAGIETAERDKQQSAPKEQEKYATGATAAQSMISVHVAKLDKLMDLVGELVIAEAMVTQNPDLAGLELPSFQQAARQLHKITNEIQETVMSVRMVPLTTTFLKMQRIVRDMGKKLNKEVKLQLIGEETEVDKNVIEHLSDPLMHLIRNAIDHGIETAEERVQKGKPVAGTIILEAKHAGSFVLVIVKDDGRGLDKDKILQKARRQDLLTKPEAEYTDKEIYSLIFLPGFSTNEKVTEYSGRGVGMDVVVKNLEAIGGTVFVDSQKDQGTVFTLKIPLTLSIIEGMNINVGKARFTIPVTSIRESVRLAKNKLVKDPDGNEMIMVRGECYPIIRLHEFYALPTEVTDLAEGIFVMVEHDDKRLCLFADEILGQQEVVVKSLPNYLQKHHKIRGIGGCTLLGDGSISLILDIGGFMQN